MRLVTVSLIALIAGFYLLNFACKYLTLLPMWSLLYFPKDCMPTFLQLMMIFVVFLLFFDSHWSQCISWLSDSLHCVMEQIFLESGNFRFLWGIHPEGGDWYRLHYFSYPRGYWLPPIWPVQFVCQRLYPVHIFDHFLLLHRALLLHGQRGHGTRTDLRLLWANRHTGHVLQKTPREHTHCNLCKFWISSGTLECPVCTPNLQ